MKHKIFITGTDTHIGKTYISVGLLKLFTQWGYTTLGLKPLATGGIRQNSFLYNADALALQQASSVKLAYYRLNPFCFEPPIAPHIAAASLKKTLSVELLKRKTEYGLYYPVDVCLVEGIGGWYVPLNNLETMADYVISCDLSVILVVGIRLGCLNHALLTYQAIQSKKTMLLGWIANCLNPERNDNEAMIVSLKQWLPIPFLGTVEYKEKPEYSLQKFACSLSNPSLDLGLSNTRDH